MLFRALSLCPSSVALAALGALTLAVACSSPSMTVAASSSGGSLAAGYEHSCSLVSGGGAVCWGQNLFGQLGDGDELDRGAPAPVVHLGGAIALAAGGYHSCVLLI